MASTLNLFPYVFLVTDCLSCQGKYSLVTVTEENLCKTCDYLATFNDKIANKFIKMKHGTTFAIVEAEEEAAATTHMLRVSSSEAQTGSEAQSAMGFDKLILLLVFLLVGGYGAIRMFRWVKAKK